MSDHHGRYFNKGDGYDVTSTSSKRYASGLGGYGYEGSADRDRKRSRTDYTGSESHSYKDYSTGTSGGGPVYKSYYEGGSAGSLRPLSSLPSSTLKSSAADYQSSSRREDYLPPSSRSSSKYIADLRGNNTKTIRRIPPPPPPLVSYSKGSSSTMKTSSSSYFGESSHTAGHSSNYGSRIRQAPPEYHGHGGKYSSSTSRSFDDRKSGRDGGFKPPVFMNRVTGTVSSGSFQKFNSSRGNFRRNFVGRSSAPSGGRYDERRRATERAAASVSSKIRERERATSSRSYEKRRSSRKREDDGDDIKTTTSNKDEDEKSVGKDAVDNIDIDSEVHDKEETEDKAEDDTGKSETGGVKIKVENGGDENAENENDKVEDESKEKNTEDKSKSRSKSDSRNRDRSSKKENLDDKDKTLLKLHCIYCDVKCISFREFTMHLRSFAHNRSMNTAVTDMRKKLSKLRNEQRDDQRKLEKKAGDTELSDTTSYCRVCELNFRTDPKEHEANELHNNIKTIIYQRCDICDIDFRIWKVYIYHMSALEHAKRVALKELALLGEGETVKGTNLSHEELGFDLVVEKTMLHCNACVRYIPIRDSKEETLNRHCMTLTHIKYVGEFRDKERKYAERRKEEEERKLADIEKQKKKEQEEAENAEKNNEMKDGGDGEDLNGEGNVEVKKELDGSFEKEKMEEEEEDKEMDTENSAGQSQEDQGDVEKDDEGNEGSGNEEDNEEDDQDEIELHAGDDKDVADDDNDDPPAPAAWRRATRSSLRRTTAKK